MSTPDPKSGAKPLKDENQPPLSDEYVTRIAKEVHAEAPNTESACVGIALAVRDIYEIELASIRTERDEAVKDRNFWRDMASAPRNDAQF